MVRAKRVGTQAPKHESYILWSGFVKHMDRRGWLLSAYTVNNPRRVRTWKNMVCMAFLQMGQTY